MSNNVREDFQRSGLPDPQVYDLAVAKQRVLVTYNVKHFQPLAGSKADAGIIGISANLPPSQIDTKLTALLTRSTPKRLAGTFTTLTGETEAQLSLHLASQLSATSPLSIVRPTSSLLHQKPLMRRQAFGIDQQIRDVL